MQKPSVKTKLRSNGEAATEREDTDKKRGELNTSANKGKPFRRIAFVDHLLFKFNLSLSEIGVYVYLSACANDKTWIANPSVREIAAAVQISRPTVISAIRRLLSLGLIMSIGKRKRRSTAKYRIQFTSELRITVRCTVR